MVICQIMVNYLIDHGIESPERMIDQYIDYIMGVPGIFELNQNGIIVNTNQTLGERLIELENLGKTARHKPNRFPLLLFSFQNKKVLIKGCGSIKIPESIYIEITKKLQNTVSSLMFGEACSSVPIFKQK